MCLVSFMVSFIGEEEVMKSIKRELGAWQLEASRQRIDTSVENTGAAHCP